jgi:hypothetical protein
MKVSVILKKIWKGGGMSRDAQIIMYVGALSLTLYSSEVCIRFRGWKTD